MDYLELRNSIWACAKRPKELFQLYKYCVKNNLAPNNIINKNIIKESLELDYWYHYSVYTKTENWDLYDRGILLALLKGLVSYKKSKLENKKGGR